MMGSVARALATIAYVHLCLYCTVVAAKSSKPFVWLGNVTSSSFTLHADVEPSVGAVILSTSPSFDPVVATLDPSDEAALPLGNASIYGRLRRFVFVDLLPSTHYYIATATSTASSGSPADASALLASTRTFPREGDASDVVIALGSCQLRSRWDDAFASIHARYRRHAATSKDPYLFLHMGDLHYSDIAVADARRFEAATRAVLTTRNAHQLFSAVPVAYVYDDHDYGTNNAGFDSPSRRAALANFRAMVPSPRRRASPATAAALATTAENNGGQSEDEEGVYHAFTVGRVRIIVSDLRAFAGQTAGSTLGLRQRAWLFAELGRARDFAVVVWVSSKPWIGAERRAGQEDSWAGYAGERRLIANRIRDLNVTNLVMVSGDAHMLGLDDGSNSDYASASADGSGGGGGGGGFPVIQAAPLANMGSGKGGPYSHGCHAYRVMVNRQFSELRISKTEAGGDGPCVKVRGWRVHRNKRADEQVLEFGKCGRLSAVRGQGGMDRSCSIALAPTWAWATMVVFMLWFASVTWSLVVACCMLRKGRKTGDGSSSGGGGDGAGPAVGAEKEGEIGSTDNVEIDEGNRRMRRPRRCGRLN